MRERAQASVETIGLVAAAVLLAALLGLGVVRLAPPFASVLRGALAGVVSPGSPTAPGLDGLERALLAGATGDDADGPTMLDLRTHLRSRLDRAAADAAFAAILRPAVRRAFDDASIESLPGHMTVVDRASEDAWVRHRLSPGVAERSAGIVAGILGARTRLLAAIQDVGAGSEGPADGIYPGHAAGDIVVQVADTPVAHVVLRRRPATGFAVIATFDASGTPVEGGGR